MRLRTLLLMGMGVAAWLGAVSDAERIVIQGGNGPVMIRGGIQAAQPQTEQPAGDKDAAPFIAQRFDTNADAEVLMERARDSFENDQAHEALLMCQRVMDKYGRSLTSVDGQLYMPASRAVERMIAGQSAEVLALYRLSADTAARALLGGPVEDCRDAAKLLALHQRYFLSSLGDEATYRLGCLRLDHGRYRAAAKYFQRVLEHPDQSPEAPAGASGVDRRELHWRLALCLARVGDAGEAAALLDALKQSTRSDQRAKLVASVLDQRRQRLVTHSEPGHWPHSHAGVRGEGVMAGLGESGRQDTGGEWAVLWNRKFSMRLPNYTQQQRTGYGQNISRHSLIESWRSSGWVPSAQLIFHEGSLWLRSHDGLVCLDTTTGRSSWPDPYRQPGDAVNATIRQHYYHRGSAAPTMHPQSIFAFADSAVRSLSWIDSTVYCIEGTPMVNTPDANVRSRSGSWTNYGLSQALTAVDARTGKLRWRTWLGTDPELVKHRIGSRILNAPVLVADRLLVTFSEQGQLFAAVLDPRTGKPLADPIYLVRLSSGYLRWSPLGVLARDDRVYLTDGQGIVVSIDVAEARIEWARMFPQDPDRKPNPVRTHHRAAGMAIVRFGMMSRVPQGELTHVAMYHADGYLVVVDSEYQTAYQVDPTSGRLRRDASGRVLCIKTDVPDASGKTEPFTYALGVYRGGLILADPDEVISFDLRTGRLKWRAMVSGITGRAALTSDALFVPVDDEVFCINPANGKRVSRKKLLVELDQPLGNLYSDGRRLLSVGMDRVAALVDTGVYEEALTRRYREGDAEALLERAILHRQRGQQEQAMADLRLAHKSLKGKAAERVRREMVELLMLHIDKQPHEVAMARLDEARQLAPTRDLRVHVLMARARRLMQEKQTNQAAAVCLQIIQLGGSEMIHITEADGQLSIRADQWAANRLRQLWHDRQAAAVDWTAPSIRQALDQALDEDDLQQLYDLSLLLAGYPIGDEAVEALRRAVKDQGLTTRETRLRFEWTEALLRELALDERADIAAGALADLARFYAEIGWPRQAARRWGELIRTHPAQTLLQDGQPVQAQTLAQQQLETLGSGGAHEADVPIPPFARWWKLSASDHQPLFLHEWVTGDDDFFNRHLLTYSSSFNRLELHSLTRKRDGVWSLRLPDQVRLQPRRSSYYYTLAGGIDGHTLIIRQGSALMGVGAVSGQMHWKSQMARVPDVRYATPPDLAGRLNYPFSVGHGVVAETVDDEDGLSDVLRVVESRTGRELWRRTLKGRLIQHLHVHPRFVIALYDSAKRLALFDRRSGRHIGGYDFDQPLTNHMALFTDQFLIYHSGEALNCLALETGQLHWKKSGSGVRRMQLLDDQHLAIVWSNQTLEIIDPHRRADKTLWEAKPEVVGKYIYDLAISPDGRRIYTFARFPDNTWALVCCDANSGKRLIGNISTGRYANYRIALRDMVRCGPFLPLVQRDGNSSTYRVCFYDRTNGKLLENVTLPFGEQDDRISSLRSPPLILGDNILVHSSDDLHLFGSARPPRPRPAEDKPAPPDPME